MSATLPELRAMQAIADAVTDLSDDEVARVARWFSDYAGRNAGGQTGRGISNKWRSVLTTMMAGEMDIDAIQRAATEAGEKLTRAQARAQLHNYVNAGWVEKLDEGRYAITDRGREMVA
jgi:hypothetical protein